MGGCPRMGGFAVVWLWGPVCVHGSCRCCALLVKWWPWPNPGARGHSSGADLVELGNLFLPFCCGRKEGGLLTLLLLEYQMPVAKRPRKSSSEDQGSPSLTEEENSETSSESEKNSDQVRGFGVWQDATGRAAPSVEPVALSQGLEKLTGFTFVRSFPIFEYLGFPSGLHS